MMEPLRNGLMRPFTRLDIEIQPVGQPAFVGTLKAATYRAGAVHRFRVADAQGVIWLVPPAWLSAHFLRAAEMAFDRLDAWFLDVCRIVPHDIIWKAVAVTTNMPEGLAPAEIVARLKQRKMEPVA